MLLLFRREIHCLRQLPWCYFLARQSNWCTTHTATGSYKNHMTDIIETDWNLMKIFFFLSLLFSVEMFVQLFSQSWRRRIPSASMSTWRSQLLVDTEAFKEWWLMIALLVKWERKGLDRLFVLGRLQGAQAGKRKLNSLTFKRDWSVVEECGPGFWSDEWHWQPALASSWVDIRVVVFNWFPRF